MSRMQAGGVRRLPAWLMVVGSAALGLHLLALAVLALGAPSGPWPSPFGPSMALAPQFVQELNRVGNEYYLQPLHMTHNYHFATNRPAAAGVYFEVRLKDTAGKPMKTLRFPEAGATFWVRHRQQLLAQGLADDQPVQPPAGEVIAAPNQKMRTVTIWEQGPDRVLRLKAVPEHLVPRDRPVTRPSAWSLLLVRSYVRYLCREHGAASAELIRHTREPVFPALLLLEQPPPGTFDELVSDFGEYREK